MPWATVTLTAPYSATGYNLELFLPLQNACQINLMTLRLSGLVGTPHLVKFQRKGGGSGQMQLVDYGTHDSIVSVARQIGTDWIEQHAFPGKPVAEFHQRNAEMKTVSLGAARDETETLLTFTYVTFQFSVYHEGTPNANDSFDRHRTDISDNTHHQALYGRWSQSGHTGFNA